MSDKRNTDGAKPAAEDEVQDAEAGDEGEGHEAEDAAALEDEAGEDDRLEDGGVDADVEDQEADGDGEQAEGARVADERRGGKSASDVIRAQRQRARDAERRADEAERRRADADRRAEDAERRNRERDDTRRRESEQEERDRVALMSVPEQIEHFRRKDQENFSRQLGGLQFQMADRDDKNDFRAACAENPLYLKVRDKVETQLADMRQKGNNVSREALAKYLIGEMVLKREGRATVRQGKTGKERIERETTRPRSARGSAAAPRERRQDDNSPEARRRRLADVQL